ncbi:unnamed protein product, partial [Prorocentrum cordatum]
APMYMLRPTALLGGLAALGRASGLGVWAYFDATFGHTDMSQNVRLNLTSNMTFDSFIDLHGREYDKGSEEYIMRAELYKAHADAVRRQNSDPARLWQAKITHLADRTKEELASLRGYRRGAGRRAPAREMTAPRACRGPGCSPGGVFNAARVLSLHRAASEMRCREADRLRACTASEMLPVVGTDNEYAILRTRWAPPHYHRDRLERPPRPRSAGWQRSCRETDGRTDSRR